MYERIEECPACGSTESENELICKDFSVSQESFVIVKCKKCEFRYTNPRPTEQQISRYYQSTEYISHQDTNKGIISRAYYLVKQKTLRNKINLINEIHQKGSLLDIGCGTGSFLELCKNNGWQVAGIEPDENARKKAQEKIKNDIGKDVLSFKNQGKFDIITLWHVLEHIHKLNLTLKKIRQMLSTDGKLIIAVPNINSYDSKYFGEYWAAYDIPRHLYHFSKESLVNVLKNHALKLERIQPMKYDAFYISLLSTKYKYDRIDYAAAIKQGIKSNLYAKTHDNNYSSLTYIFSN